MNHHRAIRVAFGLIFSAASSMCVPIVMADEPATAPASQPSEGVSSNYLDQWVMVDADVKTVTNAAKMVFTDDRLTDVSAESTRLDGCASGLTADKTQIQASISRTETGAKLKIRVGKIGDPKMGAAYAAKIKQVAEEKKS